MGLIDAKWKGSSLKQDASNRLVTDSEKTTWNNKANNSHTHTKSEVGLGNVDNTADSTKSVKYATSAGSTSNVIDVGVGSADTSRHVWFSNTSPETSRVYSDKFQYNPATDVLTVGSITGSASSAASVPWSGVTGKPSTFTPSAHTHTITEVTDLQTTLDGKAAKNHVHDSEKVTNWNNAIVSGAYYAAADATNNPSADAAYSGNVVKGSTIVTQTVVKESIDGDLYKYIRRGQLDTNRTTVTTWGQWQEIQYVVTE